MRLIDADKLHYIRKLFEDSDKSEVVVFAKEIDKAPTVKAIPIAWIENWMYGLYFGNSDEVCKKLIADWRKDNGIIRVADNS